MSGGKARAAIDRGNDARRAGRLDAALGFYREALTIAPDDAEANSLSGLVLLHLGRPAEAEPGLRKAVEREPQHIGFRLNLAEFLEKQGRLEEAAAALEAVTKFAPEFPRGWERLGDLLLQTQRPADAFARYERAFALEPGNQAIAVKWAATALALNRLGEARQILDRAARLAPDDPNVFRLYAEILTAQSDWAMLERVAATWAATRPSEAAGWRALATAAYETGRLRQAMECYRQVIELSVRSAPSLTVYAGYCLTVSEFDEAEAALAEAEALDPNHVEMLSTKAYLLTYLGRFDEAESYCRRGLALDPTHAPAYRILSQVKRGQLSNEECAILARLSRQQNVATKSITASFVLADCLDARGEFDEAFAAYQLGNRLSVERSRDEKSSYDAKQRADLVDTIISVFSQPTLRVHDEFGPCPIFIVGMPRSGTTLIEGVLAAHSRVFACGERTAMPQIIVDFLQAARRTDPPSIPPQRWQNWARAYWYALPKIGSADHITDKNPFNFDAAGLIVQIFPTAKIIHVRRNPLETGLSIFSNELPKFVTFANRLEDIGQYYGQYARLVAHWERVLGDRFITIQYEDFVARFATEGPALVAACGLAWEDACREPDQHVRPIATLSAVQAREAVTVREGRARQYRAYLAPLIEALDAAGVDLTTGALRAGK